MDILRLTISCLTGFGALALVLALLGAIMIVVTLRRMKREEPQKVGDATFTRREVERMAAVRYRYQQQVLSDDEIDRAQRDAW